MGYLMAPAFCVMANVRKKFPKMKNVSLECSENAILNEKGICYCKPGFAGNGFKCGKDKVVTLVIIQWLHSGPYAVEVHSVSQLFYCVRSSVHPLIHILCCKKLQLTF